LNPSSVCRSEDQSAFCPRNDLGDRSPDLANPARGGSHKKKAATKAAAAQQNSCVAVSHDWIERATGVSPVERTRLSPQAHDRLLVEAHHALAVRKVKRNIVREWEVLSPEDQLRFLVWASRQCELRLSRSDPGSECAVSGLIARAFGTMPEARQRTLLAQLMQHVREPAEAADDC
jgi:hypothetical protein